MCIAAKRRQTTGTDSDTFQQWFFEWPAERTKAEELILKAEDAHDVYFCVNLLVKRNRRKEDVLPETDLVWADLDGIDPETLDKFPPPITWRTSPGNWQAVWRMSSPVPAQQAEDYSRRMAYLVDADKSGWDLTQLLRVPMTYNLKYDPPAYIELERMLEITAKPMLFETLPTQQIRTRETAPLPEIPENLDAEKIIHKYRIKLDNTFLILFSREPEGDWSIVLWRFLNECFRVGMTREEVFVIALEASCNKYARDGRPPEHLWRDVLKAGEGHASYKKPIISMPILMEKQHSLTFVDEYREWASLVTDAIPDYHNLCILIALSAIVSGSVKLDTGFGQFTPNLWGMLIGDSTITRKTTAMRLVLDFLLTMDKEWFIASDGTAEGLLNGLAARPHKTSIFHRDEVSGLFDSMGRKDYMAGMQETLTALYDSPQIYTKKLAKQTIIVERPAFVMLCGGVPGRIIECVDDEFIYSGFLPRFLISWGEAVFDENTYKPMGPADQSTLNIRPEIFNKLADLYETYTMDVETKIGGQKVLMPPVYRAKLTEEAWDLNGKFEKMLVWEAHKSSVNDLASPTMDRLSKSILKVAIILGAIRQKPDKGIVTVEEQDVINAACYVQPWGSNAIRLMLNAGKGFKEKQLDKVYFSIEDEPGIFRSDLMKKHRLDKRTADDILLTLEERGMVRKEKIHRGYAYWPVF